MLICIPDILPGSQLQKLAAVMGGQRFIDGRETAGWATAGVKQNSQVASNAKDHAAMQAMVTAALAANPFFGAAAWCARCSLSCSAAICRAWVMAGMSAMP